MPVCNGQWWVNEEAEAEWREAAIVGRCGCQRERTRDYLLNDECAVH